jgi:thiosulfate reductase cytochrome b subunit
MKGNTFHLKEVYDHGTLEHAPGFHRTGHGLIIRVTHWINAVAMTCMVLSGWQIYNASPLLPYTVPASMTLGGWLAGGLAWHFAFMWLLVLNGLIYLGYGVVSGHFRRRFFPLRIRDIRRDLAAAVSFRLRHRDGTYNAVQRLSYVVVLGLGTVVVLSGLAIWKPVQLRVLTAALGGYDIARWIHCLVMIAIVSFTILHLIMVAAVPRTLVGMIARRTTRNAAGE